MKYILFAVFFSIHFQILSWGELGHEVVAQIAWSKLTPTTKNEVKKILSLTSPFYAENKNFVTASKWADLIKGINNNFNKWHYIDLPYAEYPLKIVSQNDNTNIFTALCQTISLIQSAHNPLDQAWALPMLIHLIGDIHQPLHTISRFTKQHPKGDLGGSLFMILHKGKPIGLHLYWDLGLGLLGKPGGIYFPSKNEDLETLQIADKWMTEFPPNFFRNRLTNLHFKEWIKDSHLLAKTSVYQTSENQTPSFKYIIAGQNLTKEQVVLAGYRLAYLLEKIFKTKDPINTDCDQLSNYNETMK